MLTKEEKESIVKKIIASDPLHSSFGILIKEEKLREILEWYTPKGMYSD